MPKIFDQDPTDADFVDRVFAYLEAHFPGLPEVHLRAAREAVRQRFAGERAYIPQGRSPAERDRLAGQVLSLFNGRNAHEVARSLGIGRATVYRVLKQARGAHSLTLGRHETAAALRSSAARVTRPAAHHHLPTTEKDASPWPSHNPTSTPSTPPLPAESSPSVPTEKPSPTAA